MFKKRDMKELINLWLIGMIIQKEATDLIKHEQCPLDENHIDTYTKFLGMWALVRCGSKNREIKIFR